MARLPTRERLDPQGSCRGCTPASGVAAYEHTDGYFSSTRHRALLESNWAVLDTTCATRRGMSSGARSDGAHPPDARIVGPVSIGPGARTTRTVGVRGRRRRRARVSLAAHYGRVGRRDRDASTHRHAIVTR